MHSTIHSKPHRIRRGKASGLLRLLAVVFSALLIFAACGGDDDDDDTSSPATETTDGTEATDDTGGDTDGEASGVEGCGEGAATDLSDRSPGREPARCEPEAPAPQPLAERTTVRVATVARAEFAAPLFLGDQLGEFDKENIDIEWVQLTPVDAIPQIIGGGLDVSTSDIGPGFVNAVNQGLGVQMVMATNSYPDAGDTSIPQTGVWARRDAFSDPDNPDFSELNGKTVGDAVPIGGVGLMSGLAQHADEGMDVSTIQVQQIPYPEMATALQNGSIPAGLVPDPFWQAIVDNPDIFLLSTLPPGEPLAGYMYGPRLLDEEPEVGEAFARAIIRTINTYLTGDYKGDDQVVADLAAALQVEPATLAGTPPLLFDWEFREGSIESAQQLFIDRGTLEFEEPIPEDELINRSVVASVLGLE